MTLEEKKMLKLIDLTTKVVLVEDIELLKKLSKK